MSATLAPQDWREVTAPPPHIAFAAAGVAAGYDDGTLTGEELCRLVAELAARADLWMPLVVRDAARRRYRLMLEDARLDIWVLSWIIAPLVTPYMAMKVGRSREFLADAMSAQFTRNPGALADALEKIGSSTDKPTAIAKSSAQLCIVDPFQSTWGDRQGRLADLMATHPPLRDRIARLRAMAYQANPVPQMAAPTA